MFELLLFNFGLEKYFLEFLDTLMCAAYKMRCAVNYVYCVGCDELKNNFYFIVDKILVATASHKFQLSLNCVTNDTTRSYSKYALLCRC